jgi:hypothetical protein
MTMLPDRGVGVAMFTNRNPNPVPEILANYVFEPTAGASTMNAARALSRWSCTATPAAAMKSQPALACKGELINAGLALRGGAFLSSYWNPSAPPRMSTLGRWRGSSSPPASISGMGVFDVKRAQAKHQRQHECTGNFIVLSVEFIFLDAADAKMSPAEAAARGSFRMIPGLARRQAPPDAGSSKRP